MARFKSEVAEKEAKKAIAALKKNKQRAISLLLEKLESSDPAERQAGITLMPHLADSRAIRRMKRMLSDRRLQDEHRIDILELLQNIGIQIDMDGFVESLRDPGLAQDRVLRSMLDAISSRLALSVFVNITDEKMPPELQALYLIELAKLGDQRATPMLQCFLWSPHEQVSLAAIAGLSQLKDPTAIPALGELMQYGHSEEIRSQARRALGNLVMNVGDQKDHGEPDPEYPLNECLLSAVDGSGSQICMVIRHMPGGKLAAAHFLFNDEQGLNDCFLIDTNEDELNELLDELMLSEVGLVSAPLDRCRQAIETAKMMALESGRGLPLLYYAVSPMLQGADDREIEETALSDLELNNDRPWLEESPQLLELVECESWFFEPGDWPGYDEAVEALAELKGARLETELEKRVTEGLEAIMDQEFRQLWHGRLMRQAWTLAQLYDDQGEAARWALAAARALEDDSAVPSSEHPLLREMMRLTLTIPPEPEFLDEMYLNDWGEPGVSGLLDNLFDHLDDLDEDW